MTRRTLSLRAWGDVFGHIRSVRIPVKHLVTLEPSISEDQTAEMQKENVQLVVLLALHETFTAKQRGWLWTVRAFIDETKRRQNDQPTTKSR